MKLLMFMAFQIGFEKYDPSIIQIILLSIFFSVLTAIGSFIGRETLSVKRNSLV